MNALCVRCQLAFQFFEKSNCWLVVICFCFQTSKEVQGKSFYVRVCIVLVEDCDGFEYEERNWFKCCTGHHWVGKGCKCLDKCTSNWLMSLPSMVNLCYIVQWSLWANNQAVIFLILYMFRFCSKDLWSCFSFAFYCYKKRRGLQTCVLN